MKRVLRGLLAAVQFLTRIPVPDATLGEVGLAEAAPYFPVVGAGLGLAAAGVDAALRAHLGVMVAAGGAVLFLVLATGALHEDGLADSADGFGGGGHTAERVLAIMRDSRIGSYGAVAVTLSLLLRIACIAALRPQHALGYFVAAETLSRWCVLPLAYWLPPARAGQPSAGQGARIAAGLSAAAVWLATLLAAAVTALSLGAAGWLPWTACVLTTAASGLYFRRRLRGVTGDCFGAAIQLTALAVYLCGAWR
ncbi:MAG: adenosylcobinamide-GDP ribazoletransferase [Steroidobacteraceae bacterium]